MMAHKMFFGHVSSVMLSTLRFTTCCVAQPAAVQLPCLDYHTIEVRMRQSLVWVCRIHFSTHQDITIS